MRVYLWAAILGVGVVSGGAPVSAQVLPPCKYEGVSTGIYNITVAKDSPGCTLTVSRKGSWETGKMVTPAAHGTGNVTLNGANADFTYTPAKGYTGPDMFRAEIAATRPFLHRINVTVTP